MTVHTTSHELEHVAEAGAGKGRYLAVAIVIMLVATHYVPASWWFPPAKVQEQKKDCLKKAATPEEKESCQAH